MIKKCRNMKVDEEKVALLLFRIHAVFDWIH
jgi:hypothetical protein